MEWVDVAGLCKGAHRGEGLGNRFLGTIRDCNAICHVLRVLDSNPIISTASLVEEEESSSRTRSEESTSNTAMTI
jgi:ribosome-binding ATPase YchF (GTP1/OBG family)